MNEITVLDDGKIQIFQGKKYYLRESQGYYYTYRNDGGNSLLHRMVWISHNGEIKKGYEIHHINGDKSNNEIENLQCMSKYAHKEYHTKNASEETKEKKRNNLSENARPKAAEWHGSTVGREWHKQHFQEMKDKMFVKSIQICKECGAEYESNRKYKTDFCTPKCRSKNRRKSGIDNESRICVVCGKEFIVNKYFSTQTCGRICGRKSRI